MMVRRFHDRLAGAHPSVQHKTDVPFRPNGCRTLVTSLSLTRRPKLFRLSFLVDCCCPFVTLNSVVPWPSANGAGRMALMLMRDGYEK